MCAFVDGELKEDGVAFESSNDRLRSKSFGTSPENIIIDLTGFIGLAFASGFATKAGGGRAGYPQRAVQENS
jgi:hypothetical protein